MTNEERAQRIAALTEELNPQAQPSGHPLKPALLIRIETLRNGNVKCET